MGNPFEITRPFSALGTLWECPECGRWWKYGGHPDCYATGNYWAGVWGVHEDGRVEVLRRAKIHKHPEPLPQQVVQAMAYRIHAHHRTPIDQPNLS